VKMFSVLLSSGLWPFSVAQDGPHAAKRLQELVLVHKLHLGPGPLGQLVKLVLEELYELAKWTGAQVEFVDEEEFLQSLGGVGAILRY